MSGKCPIGKGHHMHSFYDPQGEGHHAQLLFMTRSERIFAERPTSSSHITSRDLIPIEVYAGEGLQVIIDKDSESATHIYCVN